MDMRVELAGYDYAASLLTRYDPQRRTWDLPKEADFWDAVALARERGERGARRRVALIDGGFDTGMPALADVRVWGVQSDRSAHGTAVALLVREVAPECELLLYSASTGESLTAELVTQALTAAVADGADIINVSAVVSIPGTSTAKEVDLADAMLRLDHVDYHWRELLSVPSTPLGDAVAAAHAAGCVVIASSGNDASRLYLPAVLPAVFSVGFLVEERLDNGDVLAMPPEGYSQTVYADYQLIQPPGVLGTSFAAPLITGFAALMNRAMEVYSYREMVTLAGYASGLMSTLDDGASEDQSVLRGRIDQLYARSLKSDPHQHSVRNDLRPCPECSVFASQSYIDAGLWCLRCGDLGTGERLLRAARSFAPRNAAAAANLAIAIASKADQGRQQLTSEELSEALGEAAEHMEWAATVRPCHPLNSLFRARSEEFRRAAEDPTGWHLV